jgi:WD40 repeat protein
VLEEKAGTTLLFWDACRNNPLADKLLGSTSQRHAHGAAPIEPRSGNTFVIFSASPGKDALDGAGRNSPFAEALGRRIGTPDIQIESMLTMVASDVMAATDQQQLPERVSKLSQAFYFNAEGDRFKAQEEEIRQLRLLLAKAQATQQKRDVRFTIGPINVGPRAINLGPQQPKVTRNALPSKGLQALLEVDVPRVTIIRRMRVSPDGKILAIGGDDGVIRLVSLESFSVLCDIPAHSARVSDLDFSPDGRVLLSTGRDGAARLWPIAQMLASDNPGHFVGPPSAEPLKLNNSSLFSGRINPGFPDRFVLFGGGDGRLYARDLRRNKLITDIKLNTGPVTSVAYQPNGKGTYFSTSTDGHLSVRLPEGKRVTVKAHDGRIFQGDYIPDGSVAYTVGSDRAIKLWETKSGFAAGPSRVLKGHLSYVLTAGASRDNKLLVSGGGDKAVDVWSIATGELTARLTGHVNDVEAVALTPDNRFVISASEDKSLRIWSLENRAELVRIFYGVGSGAYAGLTFDNQVFGTEDLGLFTISVDGERLPTVRVGEIVKFLGRGISIYRD